MNLLELHFPIVGATLPVDHGYDLYAAVSCHIPNLHTRDLPIRVGPIAGTFAGRGLLQLDPRRSRLRLRLSAEEIPTLLRLAGKGLNVGGHALPMGVPQVMGLTPAPALRKG